MPPRGSPQTPEPDESARRERFARTREVLRMAAERTPAEPTADQPKIDDATLDALIERTRRV